jgi:hypothetical protein
MRDRIDAAAFAVGVFAVLYLAEGMRLFAGHSWWYVLIWPAELGIWRRAAMFLFVPFAAVSLLVYRLRLQGLLHNQSLVLPGVSATPGDKAIEANAVLTALAVFLVPYLAFGVGLVGFRNWMSLLWPLDLWGRFNRFVLFVLAGFAAVSLFVWWLKRRYLLADKTATEALASPWKSLWQMPPPEPQARTQTLERELEETKDRLLRALAETENLRRKNPPDSEVAALREEVATLHANLENETRQAAQARMRAAEAEAKLRKAEMRAEAAEANAGKQRTKKAGKEKPPPRDEAAADKGGDEKFKKARREFSKMYHPDTIQKEGFEKMIRAEIYKEFWQVLTDIDKGKA